MTRADDERLLYALDLYARGHTIGAVARATGIPQTSLRRYIARIRTEDSLTDPAAEAYWSGVPDTRRFIPNDPDTAPHRHHGTRRFR